MKQTILFLRNGSLYANRTEAIRGLNSIMHKAGQPVIALYGTAGSVELIMAIGTEDGEYKILQECLVDGINIKTINGSSILGSGNLNVGNIEALDPEESLDDIITDGDGTKFLSDDGTYKEISCDSPVYITPFTISDILGNYTSIELTKEQVKGLMEAASQNSILCVPYSSSGVGGLVISYEYSNDNSIGSEIINFIILSDGIEKTLQLIYYQSDDSWYWNGSYTHRISLSYKSKYVDVDENVADISGDSDSYQYDSYIVNGECEELHCYLEPQERPITIHFLTGENCTIEIVVGAQWANGIVPTIEPHTEYELSLVGNMVGTFNAVLTPFKTVE